MEFETHHVAAQSGSWDVSPFRGEPPYMLSVRQQRRQEV
jgi:hypothetical protein